MLIDTLKITVDNVNLSEDENTLYIDDVTFRFNPKESYSCLNCVFRKKCSTQHLTPVVMCGGDNYPRDDRRRGIWVLADDGRWWTTENIDTRTEFEKAMLEFVLG